jgi:hypothetical protein
MLSELGKTGLAHQIVLTKLDRAPATLWNELAAALHQNPVRVAPYKSAARPQNSEMKTKSELLMGAWAPLRGQLALGCDETILGISSSEGWGIEALRYSILNACGVLRAKNSDDNYLRALKEAPVVGEGMPNAGEDRVESNELGHLGDDNPMRGEFFGGKETFRKRIHRW